MRSLKRIFAAGLTSIILLSTTVVANAETSQDLNNQLKQSEAVIQEKETQQDALTSEMKNVQADLQTIENEITENNKNINAIQKNIEETKQLIEEKKEQIVILEDKVLARKGIMQERLVSLQHTDQTNIFLEVILNSESLADLLGRASAASTILNADKELLTQQQQDLQQIEDEKAVIDEQEKHLNEQYTALAAEQANLKQNLQNRQVELAAVQERYNKVASEISVAEKEKSAIQAQITAAQEKLKREQEAAAARAKQVAQEEAAAKAKQVAQEASANKTVSQSNESKTTSTNTNNSSDNNKSKTTSETTNKTTNKPNGKELYVTATAYTPNCSGCSGVTATGINVKANPNMKLIAVDPSVIPLGSRVWVEGYGEAIAADTGGAIKGHKIDVLMSSDAVARQWGRKTVKIIVR